MRADLKPPRRARILTVLLVAVLHAAAFFGLLHAFAPDFTTAVIDRAQGVLSVTVTVPDKPPEPPAPEPTPDAGASGDPARQARPKEVAAPKPPVPLAPVPVPSLAAPEAISLPVEGVRGAGRGASGTGGLGAASDGTGTGAAGQGDGTGSGQSGSGTGSGIARQAQKIAGDINSAKDYPRATRDLRIGHSVTIVLTVGTDGRVRSCRVAQPSPDADANAITCRLATDRFRFRPAEDASGNAVEGRYAWRQRWYY